MKRYQLAEYHLFQRLGKLILFNVETMLFYEVDPVISDAITCFEQAPDADIPCLLYTSPSPRDRTRSRMPSSA